MCGVVVFSLTINSNCVIQRSEVILSNYTISTYSVSIYIYIYTETTQLLLESYPEPLLIFNTYAASLIPTLLHYISLVMFVLTLSKLTLYLNGNG